MKTVEQMKTVELRFTIPGMYLATPNYLLSALSPQLFPYICYFFITGKWIKLFIDILNIKVVFWFIPYCSDWPPQQPPPHIIIYLSPILYIIYLCIIFIDLSVLAMAYE